MTIPTDWFNDLAKFAGSAMLNAADARRDIEELLKRQVAQWLGEMHPVTREEFDRVREMAIKAREENEQLKAELAALRATSTPKKPKKAS
jgi:BMFP domain-containing protein YqiC